MGRVTISIGEDEEGIIGQNIGDGGGYESRSEFVRECIQQYEDRVNARERVAELETELDRVREARDALQKQADRVDELEQDVERLQNEKRMILEEREEKKELARYVEDERTMNQKWRQAGIITRTKWKLLGMPENGQQTTSDSE